MLSPRTILASRSTPPPARPVNLRDNAPPSHHRRRQRAKANTTMPATMFAGYAALTARPSRPRTSSAALLIDGAMLTAEHQLDRYPNQATSEPSQVFPR
jgi:hypothetical protein